jgi:hypothetical protein
MDEALLRFANMSTTHRLIIRKGGNAGHYSTLIYNPQAQANERWTLLNSSRQTVTKNESPYDLLEADGVRDLTLGIFIQSNYIDPANPENPIIADGTLESWVNRPNRLVPREPASSVLAQEQPSSIGSQGPGEIMPAAPEEDDDLPPPFIFANVAEGARVEPQALPSSVNGGGALGRRRLDLERGVERELADTLTPELRDAFESLSIVIDEIRTLRPDIQYQQLKRFIEEGLAGRKLNDLPDAGKAALLQDVSRLDALAEKWAQIDQGLDTRAMRTTRAFNGAINQGLLFDDAKLNQQRDGYAMMLKASRTQYQMAPSFERRGRAEALGLADVLEIPVWSLHEKQHEEFKLNLGLE